MSEKIKIDKDTFLQQVKLSLKVPEIIESIVNQKIILEKVKEIGIEPTVEELQEGANKIRLTQGLSSANDTYQWLEKHYLSVVDFEEIVLFNIISGKLATHLFKDKVEHYFIEHKLDYIKAIIYEIILDDEELALELFYAISEEEISFFDAARQYIQDKDLQRKGGYQEILGRKSLNSDISAVVFAAKPPQLLKPVVTSKEIHLILVEEIIEPELDANLHYKILVELFSDWLKKQREGVEVMIDFLDKSP